MKKKFAQPAFLLLAALVLISIAIGTYSVKGLDQETQVPLLLLSLVFIIASVLSYNHKKGIMNGI